ncbi:hypothetical protein [Sphingomonas sp. LM7]|uniref:hypothetical protein n=1 Tax=Sphingomonas sp. LM7 TaxID=1938607 RepID=UPI000983FBCA|nr:hypothetical protein [Sphingomonas sp. LM7]AQR75101.1 hypothetical protein BXU08_16815 [Sphingomonas sp. LM7]
MSGIKAAAIAAAGLLVMTISACANGPRLAVPLQSASGKQLKIWTVTASDEGDTVLVSGMVRRPALSVGPIPGHLHVVAHFADGRPEVVADTHWGSIPVRGSRSGRYSVRLPIADAGAVANIIVSYVGSADMVDAPSGTNP